MSHANLSIFVPHVGCPNRCSFCNQCSISGAERLPDAASVTALCAAQEQRLAQRGGAAEIAFFGGSFTAIDRGYMRELLAAAAPFVRGGVFRGIRISTRPDCIDGETLDLLVSYGVCAIELGAQSMSDAVLAANLRGHTARDVEQAAALITAHGFELGLQMMTGLYGADDETDRATAHALAALHPQTVRIYPTLVLENTALAALYDAGSYRPQSLEGATTLGAELLDFFAEREIRVIRVGLHAERSLEAALVAGPYHPAFRELCEGKQIETRLLRLLAGSPPGSYTVHLSPKSVSKITGHGGETVDRLGKMGYHINIKQDVLRSGLTLTIEEV